MSGCIVPQERHLLAARDRMLSELQCALERALLIALLSNLGTTVSALMPMAKVD
jgi:hypothetical protein